MKIRTFDERIVEEELVRATFWVEVVFQSQHESPQVKSFLLEDAAFEDVRNWAQEQLVAPETLVRVHLLSVSSEPDAMRSPWVRAIRLLQLSRDQ